MQNKLLFADEFNIRFAFDDIQKLPEALKKRFFSESKIWKTFLKDKGKKIGIDGNGASGPIRQRICLDKEDGIYPKMRNKEEWH